MNRRNILKALVLSPAASLPAFGKCRLSPELFPFQKKILEDIKRFRHNVFIMPRGSSKTWMCNYIVHDGNIPSGRDSGDRKINRENRFAIRGDYFVYDELLDYEDFHIVNKPIIQGGCKFKYKNDFYNKICEKRLVLFTSINNKKISDILKTSKSSDELNIKIITYEDINDNEFNFKFFDEKYIEFMELNSTPRQIKRFKRNFLCEFV